MTSSVPTLLGLSLVSHSFVKDKINRSIFRYRSPFVHWPTLSPIDNEVNNISLRRQEYRRRVRVLEVYRCTLVTIYTYPKVHNESQTYPKTPRDSWKNLINLKTYPLSKCTKFITVYIYPYVTFKRREKTGGRSIKSRGDGYPFGMNKEWIVKSKWRYLCMAVLTDAPSHLLCVPRLTSSHHVN